MLSKDRYARPQSVESVISELLPLVVEPKTAVKPIEEASEVLETKETEVKRGGSWLFVLMSVVAVMSVTLNVLLLQDESGFLRELIIEQIMLYINLSGLA